jgi:DNA polymerase III sliding clamp (beta) subunit (PCNA family)
MLTLNVSYLRAALLSASTEETRYYLRGVQILRRGDHLRITATDGHHYENVITRNYCNLLFS